MERPFFSTFTISTTNNKQLLPFVPGLLPSYICQANDICKCQQKQNETKQHYSDTGSGANINKEFFVTIAKKKKII